MSPVASVKPQQSSSGPDPVTLAVPGPWEDTIGHAVRTAKPESGFPERPAQKRKRRPSKRTPATGS